MWICQSVKSLKLLNDASSFLYFAMKAFWLNEFPDEANAALVENCRFYMGNPKARDEHDSFFWSANVLCRLIEFFCDAWLVARSMFIGWVGRRNKSSLLYGEEIRIT